MEVFNNVRISNFDFGWKYTLSEPSLRARYRARFNAYALTRAGNRCPQAKAGYNDASWNDIDLPHDWLVGQPFDENELQFLGGKKRGNAWYRKEFMLAPECEGKQILLRFEGIAGNSEIYINGSLIKRNFSSFNEITVDITPYALFGEQINAVAVFNDRSDIEKWAYEGAGIYRHVRLIVKDAVHIAENGIWCRAKRGEGGRWDVLADVTAENILYSEKDYSLSLRMLSPGGEVVYEQTVTGKIGADSEKEIGFGFAVEAPALWDTESPNLYTVEAELTSGAMSDSERTAFGFREFSVDAERGFILNGRVLKLYGVCTHQDHAGVGTAVPDSLIEYRMNKIKSIGCNAFRCSHNMQNRELLDYCDRNGIIVMDENRAFETGDEFISLLRDQIKRDRSHPSVIFYAIFNEEPTAAHKNGKKVYEKLASEVRKLDNTRLLTAAMNDETMFGEDGVSRTLDVTGFNYRLDDFKEFHSRYPDQPLIGSEDAAAFSTRGQYATDYDKRMIICDDTCHKLGFTTIREALYTVNHAPYIGGVFIWSAFDYRGEAHLNNLPEGISLPGWPAVYSQYGLMDSCGFPKGGYWFYRAFLDKKPFIHINQHWNHTPGENVRIVTVTNCDEVELFVNGNSLGRKKSDVYTQLEWFVEFTAGKLEAVAYKDGVKAAEESIMTFSEPVGIKLEADRSAVMNDGADAVAVAVSLYDGKGNPVLTADNHICFEAEGGKILGCGNGNPVSHEIDTEPARNLFEGLCSVIVRADRGTDCLVLTAYGKGLKEGVLSFEIAAPKN